MKRAAKPEGDGNLEIRFLTLEEVEAVLVTVPDDVLGSVEGTLYLTAAMTGLRQGELLGLRWSDVDWLAGKVRVRRAYVRGEYGTTKSPLGLPSGSPEHRAAGQSFQFARAQGRSRRAGEAADVTRAAHPRPDSPLSSSSGGSKPTSTTSNPLCRSLSAYPV